VLFVSPAAPAKTLDFEPSFLLLLFCLIFKTETDIAIIRVRVNEKIKAPQVRVIDEGGKMLGVMSSDEALAMAREKGLDLIEVSPKANPPVVKVLSYDKYRYHLEKTLRQQKKNQKRVEVKGIRLSVRIGVHDLEFKAKQAEKFLADGNKAKIDLILRGRERANISYAFEVLKKFLEAIKFPHVTEQIPKRMGNVISAIIGPKVQQPT